MAEGDNRDHRRDLRHYTTPATTTADSGSQFSVVVSNAPEMSPAMQRPHRHRNRVAPTITQQPASATVTAGQTATFSVTATGTDPLSYQWLQGTTTITGATSASYTTAATTTANNGTQYKVVVSNSVGRQPATRPLSP